jgi:hypothetical protein
MKQLFRQEVTPEYLLGLLLDVETGRLPSPRISLRVLSAKAPVIKATGQMPWERALLQLDGAELVLVSPPAVPQYAAPRGDPTRYDPAMPRELGVRVSVGASGWQPGQATDEDMGCSRDYALYLRCIRATQHTIAYLMMDPAAPQLIRTFRDFLELYAPAPKATGKRPGGGAAGGAASAPPAVDWTRLATPEARIACVRTFDAPASRVRNAFYTPESDSLPRVQVSHPAVRPRRNNNAPSAADAVLRYPEWAPVVRDYPAAFADKTISFPELFRLTVKGGKFVLVPTATCPIGSVVSAFGHVGMYNGKNGPAFDVQFSAGGLQIIRPGSGDGTASATAACAAISAADEARMSALFGAPPSEEDETIVRPSANAAVAAAAAAAAAAGVSAYSDEDEEIVVPPAKAQRV